MRASRIRALPGCACRIEGSHPFCVLELCTPRSLFAYSSAGARRNPGGLSSGEARSCETSCGAHSGISAFRKVFAPRGCKTQGPVGSCGSVRPPARRDPPPPRFVADRQHLPARPRSVLSFPLHAIIRAERRAMDFRSLHLEEKPPSTRCCCRSAATTRRSGSPTSTRSPRSTAPRYASRTARSSCASSSACRGRWRTTRRSARRTSLATCGNSWTKRAPKATSRASWASRPRSASGSPPTCRARSNSPPIAISPTTSTSPTPSPPTRAGPREEAPRNEQVLPAVRSRGVLRAHRPRRHGRAARLPAGVVRDEPTRHRQASSRTRASQDPARHGPLPGTRPRKASSCASVIPSRVRVRKSVLPGGAFGVMVLGQPRLPVRVARALLRRLAPFCVGKATYLNLEISVCPACARTR